MEIEGWFIVTRQLKGIGRNPLAIQNWIAQWIPSNFLVAKPALKGIKSLFIQNCMKRIRSPQSPPIEMQPNMALAGSRTWIERGVTFIFISVLICIVTRIPPLYLVATVAIFRLCNMDIISKVQQVICFAFHDSKLLMETCQEAKNLRKIVTLFYLD